MSSISRSPSGKWWVRWRDPDGRQRTKTFPKQALAKQYQTQLDARLLEGTYIDPSAGLITFAEYAERWRKAQDHRPLTEDNVERSLRLHVYPVLGDRPLKSIRKTDLQAWAKSLEGRLAPSTINVTCRYVAAVFNAAVDDEILATAPRKGWKPRAASSKEVNPPTPDEIIAVANEITPRYRPIVLTMAATGLRPAEACGLTIDAVDRVAPAVKVDRQLVTIAGKPEFGPPKTESGNRIVPIPEWLVVEFDAHVDEYGLGPDSVIFTNTRGELVARHQFGAAWRSAAERAGVDATPHGCRHAYASVLIEAGESVKVVQKRLGHKSAMLTLDVYGHLWKSSDESTRVAISNAYDDLVCSPRVANAS